MIRFPGEILFLASLTLLANPFPAQSQMILKVQKPREASSPPTGVAIPGLGQNPWAIESYLNQRKPFENLLGSGGNDAQKQLLKSIIEEKKKSLTPEQRNLVENMMKNMGNGKGLDKAKVDQLLGQMFPEGNPATREQLRKIFEGFQGDAPGFSPSPSQPEDNPANSGNGNLNKFPPPIPPEEQPPPGKESSQDKNSNSNQESTPPSKPELTENPKPPAKNETGESPGKENPFGSKNNLDKMFQSIFPMGMDKWAKPVASDFMQWTMKWSKGWKLPPALSDGLKKALTQIKIPQTPSVNAPKFPSMGSQSLPPIGFLSILLVVGLLVGMVVWVLFQKAKLASGEDRIRSYYARNKGKQLIPAFESAVLRMGGFQGALGNHLLWKQELAPQMEQKGLPHEVVDRLFALYVQAKYAGVIPDPELERQSVETLHRI